MLDSDDDCLRQCLSQEEISTMKSEWSKETEKAASKPPPAGDLRASISDDLLMVSCSSCESVAFVLNAQSVLHYVAFTPLSARTCNP